jgi:hypothetical protein
MKAIDTIPLESVRHDRGGNVRPIIHVPVTANPTSVLLWLQRFEEDVKTVRGFDAVDCACDE